MGRALYRKYRPKTLSEVVGQKHITETISNAIKSDKISHAYLLTGTRGVGKTSLARILAHEINGLEYLDDSAQLDIIEIDAASNRRIDEIRDLRDKVHILPTGSKYKVYIIDEVHMLTKEAFNALLKTLEEPPEHVIFILATTEVHKLPETIVSRTQHFSFKPIDTPVIVEHLRNIAKQEKLKIDDAALELIARHGDGSFRDSISLLDQARGLGDNITVEQVERLLGVAPSDATDKLLAAVDTGDSKQVFELLRDLRSQGFMSGLLAKQLSRVFRERVINDPEFQNPTSLNLLNELLNVTGSPQADRLFELALLDYMFALRPTVAPVAAPAASPIQAKPTPTSKPEPAAAKPALKPDSTAEKPVKKNQEPAPEPAAPVPDGSEPFTLEVWPVVIAAIKKTHNTLYGILRMAEPRMDGDKLVLAFRFAFHQKQLNNEKNRKIVGDIIQKHTGQNIAITCIIDKESKPDINTLNIDSDTKNNIVNNVSDIFGGAEVLDS
jgi:DNA polymerase-3 subunit gamma/tau